MLLRKYRFVVYLCSTAVVPFSCTPARGVQRTAKYFRESDCSLRVPDASFKHDVGVFSLLGEKDQYCLLNRTMHLSVRGKQLRCLVSS